VISRAREELQPFGWEQSRQEIKRHAVAHLGWGVPIDGFDPHQREILLPFCRWPDASAYGIARFESEKLDLGRRDIDTSGASKVIVIGRTKKTIAIGHDFQYALIDDDIVKVEARARPFDLAAIGRLRQRRLHPAFLW